MGGLLRALGQHPVSRTVDVRTAAAAVGELVHLFSEVRRDVPTDASTEFRATTSAAAGEIDTTGGHRDDGGPWGLQSGPRERQFAAMLEEAYASSAGDLRKWKEYLPTEVLVNGGEGGRTEAGVGGGGSGVKYGFVYSTC